MLAANRLRRPGGFHGRVINPHRAFVEEGACCAEDSLQGLFAQVGEVSDGGESEAFQALGAVLADAGEFTQG